MIFRCGPRPPSAWEWDNGKPLTQWARAWMDMQNAAEAELKRRVLAAHTFCLSTRRYDRDRDVSIEYCMETWCGRVLHTRKKGDFRGRWYCIDVDCPEGIASSKPCRQLEAAREYLPDLLVGVAA